MLKYLLLKVVIIMKKILRNIFSGYFLVLLILLLELLAFIAIQFFMDDIVSSFASNEARSENLRLWVSLAYLLIRLFIFIIAVIIFFKIINKQENPEFKVPWIVTMLLMPFFACMLYLIFANHGLRKKDRKIMEESTIAFKENFKLEGALEEYQNRLGNAYGAFNYINNTTGLGVYSNNKVTYYKCGEEFFPELLESLKAAKEFIFMEFFIISDGKEWSAVQEILKDKAKEGVEIKIIYDDMGCGGTISSKTPKILAKYGIKCVKFHPFRPILSGVYNNRDHRKIVVIDHQIGFTGGMNLADEYANEITRFGYWKDTMIKIEGSAINNLITIFLQNYNLSVHKVEDYHKYLDYNYPRYEENGFVMPFGDGPSGVYDALIGEQTYINMLNYAQKEVYISTPYLIPTYGLLDAMRNASLRGVKVHLIVPGVPDKKLVYKIAQSNFRYLLDAGVNIYTYTPGFNHMKTVLVDDSLALVGTINFDFRSLVHHFECGALLYKCECMKDIKEDFLHMLTQCEAVSKEFKLNKKARRLCSLAKLFTPLL